MSLWITPCSAQQPQLVRDIDPGEATAVGVFPNFIAGSESNILFSVHHPDLGTELWHSDGTTEGTSLVIDLVPGPGSDHPSDHSVAVDGELLYFTASDVGHGHELFVSDGSASGTRIFDVFPGPGSSNPWQLTIAGDRLFFNAYDAEHGQELWAIDLAVFRDGFETGDSADWSPTRIRPCRSEIDAQLDPEIVGSPHLQRAAIKTSSDRDTRPSHGY